MRAVKKEWLLGMLCVLSGVMLMVTPVYQALLWLLFPADAKSIWNDLLEQDRRQVQ